MVQFFIAEIRQSDVSPEAFAASYQTKRTQPSACFPTKRQVRDKRYEKDAEDYYKGYI